MNGGVGGGSSSSGGYNNNNGSSSSLPVCTIAHLSHDPYTSMLPALYPFHLRTYRGDVQTNNGVPNANDLIG